MIPFKEKNSLTKVVFTLKFQCLLFLFIENNKLNKITITSHPEQQQKQQKKDLKKKTIKFSPNPQSIKPNMDKIHII